MTAPLPPPNARAEFAPSPLEIPPEQPPRVPEPASLALLAVPLAATAILMRRRT